MLQRCYEHKQYRNGLKFCKQILSNPKFSEHGGKSPLMHHILLYVLTTIHLLPFPLTLPAQLASATFFFLSIAKMRYLVLFSKGSKRTDLRF